MQDGRVSIVAKDATVRQILAEWARVGQTNIVNVDRVPGGPLTLELTNVPEAQALEVLLRSLSGYITAPRTAGAAEPVAIRSHHRHADAGVAPRPAPSAAPPPPVFNQTPQFTQPDCRRRRRARRSAQRTGVAELPAQPNARPGVQYVPAAAGREPAERRRRDGVSRSAAGKRRAAAGDAAAASIRSDADGAVRWRFGAGHGGAPPPAAQQPGQISSRRQVQQPQQPGQPVRRPGGANQQ